MLAVLSKALNLDTGWTIPISNDLKTVILELRKGDTQSEDFVLERHYAWKNGQAGEVLRQYLKDLGIKSNVVFHSLRACFATHMLASGADQATVMKNRGPGVLLGQKISDLPKDSLGVTNLSMRLQWIIL